MRPRGGKRDRGKAPAGATGQQMIYTAPPATANAVRQYHREVWPRESLSFAIRQLVETGLVAAGRKIDSEDSPEKPSETKESLDDK